MKLLLATSLCLFVSCAGYAQSQVAHERAMARIMNFFNENQGDSISAMFVQDQSVFNQGAVESMRKHYGRMRACQYMGINPADSAALFKASFYKITGSSAISLQLGKTNELTSLRFFTSSPYIDSLLKTFP